VLLDTGPIVAFLKADDVHHAWAVAMFARLRPPLLTCEPVLSEAVYLLSRLDKGAATVFELVRRGVMKVAFRLDEEIDSVSRVIAKYGPRRTDLADACLVRMSELYVDSAVLTVDSQFRDVYRRNGRRVIETLMPGGVSVRRKRGR
jgi:uncharacterized protein